MEKTNDLSITTGTFSITNQVRQKLISHCNRELPYEACGLLSGENGVAETIWPMENVNRSSYSYSMDLDQIRHVFELIDRRNEDLIGIYHSHPTDSAYPSEGDISLNNYPEVAHLIISFANSTPDIKCFQLTGKNVFPIQLKFVN
ncbi:Proteasome lid subunit RPN8/RPN11, contains Jab1/MPN metalloenzyme (JAMM) motif [Peribacillus simplex]|uniref:Proteasome lid subunit RPN8/RPN11, contains Jab1/MPN metalloenzyme (JAMM) motif n=1 Tax=Peribacillus simplex TaxID=1478 RepID=A0A9X8WLV2_9BACI|nr:M67 family metallopeptidase [Peribacillus simplex]SIR77074.1 Proteasome lid subunit RPN8/RPN11, contains Jab1/MPN metalloenzyme (JAMM) motif [Peribacillus simplex]